MQNSQETGVLDDAYSKFFPFVVEIRRRLLFTFAIILAFSTLGFIYYERIIQFALKIFALEGVNIVFTSPFQFINLAITSSLLVGTITAFPLAIYQTLSFLKPALNKKEFKSILALLPLSVTLFVGGFLFGIVIMRYVLRLFYERSTNLNVGNFLDISSLLSQILVTSIAMGIAFQFPIILTILIKLKVIKYKAVESQRIPAYIASIVFAALLPPTDILSLVLMTLPLIFLFEFTLILNKVFLKAHLL